ncbi:MAG: hypothetical protein IJC88_03690 [Oscillospiraceae bacterium]|nr:hypothetical protein [Oscillospiraceae bacterium]
MKRFSTELAYVCGLFILAIGVAMMARSDFGVSMIVAPAYLLHLKLQPLFPFFTFGVAEYFVQAILLLGLTLLMRKFKFSYLMSFVTAILYGLLLDGATLIIELIPLVHPAVNLALYTVGLLFATCGISLLFHTYLSPEVYELFVKEISAKTGWNINYCKTAYDILSCLVSIALSFLFFGFGHFEGIKFGTIFCAAVNGFCISRFSRFFERRFVFEDSFPWRKWFE